MDKKLNIVLTGCASGIGQHLATVLAGQGHNLLATDYNLSALNTYASKVGWLPSQVILRQLDVRDPAEWEATIRQATEAWGRVDVLMNIAGYLHPGLIHEIAPEEVAKHLDTNATGLIYGTQAAARQMVKQRQGHIINIASLAGIAPVPGICLYSASKFAVRGFSLAVAQELRPHGVSVTVICPDAVQTPMLDLQVDYKEAAITFSSPKPLTVLDIERAITRALKKRPVEIILPQYRGWLSKIVNCFPALAIPIGPIFTKKGRQIQEQLKIKRGV